MGSHSQNNLHNNNNNNNSSSMIALLFCFLIVAAAASDSCQMPGNAICHSSDPDLPHYVTFAPCCDGSECLPVDGSDARFCQYVQDISVGGDCSERKGSCVASSSCVDGVCV